jgi:hypothetical protein
MDEKTARKYLHMGKLPSEIKVDHDWRTRSDPFSEIWPEIKKMLEVNPGLEGKTIFEHLQRQYPGLFADGQLRTLQRRIKTWRAVEGPPKEIFFPQEYNPGEVCQSDFTDMGKLGIMIGGQLFEHLIYHFVLPYSNWETGMVCFSESMESLSEGLQNALWELGGVPQVHQTDRLSAATSHSLSADEFTRSYRGLLDHYELQGRKINRGQAHENGDVEQRHYRFKRALEQALLLRGSRDFANRKEYERFLKKLFSQLNHSRRDRLEEEFKMLGPLPKARLESCKRLGVKVGPASTIRVNHNVYSVDSRLIGERVQVRLYAEHLEVWYAQRCQERIPRLRGEEGHFIQYRHIIDWLIRKPGAFENYRYRNDLFPTHRFRIAYDALKSRFPTTGHKEYLKILHLAAKENESAVDAALEQLIDQGKEISFTTVEELIKSLRHGGVIPVKAVMIEPVNITAYDMLLEDPPDQRSRTGIFLTPFSEEPRPEPDEGQCGGSGEFRLSRVEPVEGACPGSIGEPVEGRAANG